ncbi:alanine racemase [Colwellia sp. RSH04]|uniref:alanine racemase n=1 Tax=Colwellia sp. RSH04 TaxID=2305464 RepID=UPI000E588257|nr:alanine racemase [Colwellia sp. RSH04]RHW77231.1 alanine racemase [Colwellia sp. RSH04]
MKYISRNTKAVIDLTALVHNYQYISSLAPQSKTIAVIKANGYEHCAIEVAKTLEAYVPAFAVAFVDEALTLRNAGIQSPILVLEGPFQHSDFTIAIEQDLSLMLHTHEQISWLKDNEDKYLGDVWLKVDTGMNRLGFRVEEISSVIASLNNKHHSKLVLCSHFSCAEDKENPKTTKQISQVKALVKQYDCQFSMANSAGILNWPESHGHFNRLGLSLYGVSPIEPCVIVEPLKPVMTLEAEIIAIRKVLEGETVGYGDTWQAKRLSTIAVIAIGYADGYPRNAKAGTPVFVNGEIAPLVGRVSMDMITIDVTGITKINVGDIVELWGKNVSVDTIAKHSDSINYELLTRLSARLPKTFIENNV